MCERVSIHMNEMNNTIFIRTGIWQLPHHALWLEIRGFAFAGINSLGHATKNLQLNNMRFHVFVVKT